MVSLPPVLRYGVTVALQILVLSVEVRILLSQRDPSKLLIDSNLEGFNDTTGTRSGHELFHNGVVGGIMSALIQENIKIIFQYILFSPFASRSFFDNSISLHF